MDLTYLIITYNKILHNLNIRILYKKEFQPFLRGYRKHDIE